MITSPKAYSYIRFSTPDQQHGDSYKRQYELSLAYAELNKLTLDESLTFRDLGISAFDKSNVRVGQLGVFLKAVEAKLVPVGSYLLVESLDRISRAKITDALTIFMSIVNQGITLVTLSDGMEYSKEKIDKQFTDLIISVAIMSRAHEESLLKSKRLKAAWISKRANLDKKKLTSIAPGWLELSDDKSKYLEIPEKVELVQNIFRWTSDGMGAESIARRLNQQQIPTFGSRAKNMWHTSYVKKILDNRSVLGEFQPHTMMNGKRVPTGDPIIDYFPRIISDSAFTLTSSSIQSRRTNSAGRKGVGLSNLFSGLLRCGYCMGSMVYVNKGGKGPRSKFLVCSNAKGGKDCYYIPWEYRSFEQSILSYCRGLDLNNFLQFNDRTTTEISQLADKIRILNSSLEAIELRESNIMSAIEEGAKFQLFETRVRQLSEERTNIELELLSAKKIYEEFAITKIDIKKVQLTIEDLTAQMDQLSGDALYDLRAALSQQIKRLVRRIGMYPGGFIDTPKYIAGFREHLLKKNYSQIEVADIIASNCKITPNVTERFFSMISTNGSIQTIQPNVDDPEMLEIRLSGENPNVNLEAHKEIFEDVIRKLKKASKL